MLKFARENVKIKRSVELLNSLRSNGDGSIFPNPLILRKIRLSSFVQCRVRGNRKKKRF